MLGKILSLGLVGLLATVTASIPAAAQIQSGTEQAQAEKVKLKVTRIGTGKRTRVEIRLKDDRKLKGYIGAITEEHFMLVDSKHGTVTPITYGEVEQIKDTSRTWLVPVVLGAATIGGLLLAVALSLRGS
jgi:hypothetical protein